MCLNQQFMRTQCSHFPIWDLLGSYSFSRWESCPVKRERSLKAESNTFFILLLFFLDCRPSRAI
jgi:hypothetical protein